MKNKLSISTKIAIGMYCFLLVGLLFVRTSFDTYGNYFQTIKWNINIIPFRTILYYIGMNGEWYAVKNIVGNILLFIPMGYVLQTILEKRKTYKQITLIAFVLITLFEIIQLVTLKGVFDVDDIILNLLGVTVGYITYKIVRRGRTEDEKENTDISGAGHFAGCNVDGKICLGRVCRRSGK